MRQPRVRFTVWGLMVIVAIFAGALELEAWQRRSPYCEHNAERCAQAEKAHLWLAESHEKISAVYRKHSAALRGSTGTTPSKRPSSLGLPESNERRRPARRNAERRSGVPRDIPGSHFLPGRTIQWERVGPIARSNPGSKPFALGCLESDQSCRVGMWRGGPVLGSGSNSKSRSSNRIRPTRYLDCHKPLALDPTEKIRSIEPATYQVRRLR